MKAKHVKEDYAILKKALKKRVSNMRFFTVDFLLIFEEDYINSTRTKIPCYDRTKITDFYNKNSAAYCEFLCLFYEYAHGENI